MSGKKNKPYDFKKEMEMVRICMNTPRIQAPDHKLPLTRRELIGQGFLASSAFVVAPSILQLVSQQAYGLECKAPESEGDAAAPVGFLQVELQGGAAISGNFMFGKQRGTAAFEAHAADGYVSVGVPTNFSPTDPGNLDLTFGAPFHRNSQILAGLKSVMSPEAIAKTGVAGMAAISDNDTANNPLNGIQLAMGVSGGQGQLVEIAGNRNSETGGRTRALPVGANPGISKALIRNDNDVANLVNPGLLGTRLSRDDAVKIAKAAQQLSGSQLRKFKEKALSQQLKDLAECGYQGSAELFNTSADDLGPAGDPDVNTIAQGTAAAIDLNDQDDNQIATLAKLLVDSNTGGASLNKGGYDYHNDGRPVQDALDFAAGRDIGIALELAHRKKVPLFVALTSDGSTSSNGQVGGEFGMGEARADNAARGSALMFAIGATERPKMDSNQIGAYRDNGAVDAAYLITADSPADQALNIVANYAAVNGTLEVYDQVLASNGVSKPFSKERDHYIAFQEVKK
ncbi:MAG: hypothetical protein CMP10_18960 [Zetaproteobacteria bacterium]|nr:hypothetical protein [Pseudobdellovibrionaceae bacterium]